jgi:hypothetical protein
MVTAQKSVCGVMCRVQKICKSRKERAKVWGMYDGVRGRLRRFACGSPFLHAGGGEGEKKTNLTVSVVQLFVLQQGQGLLIISSFVLLWHSSRKSDLVDYNVLIRFQICSPYPTGDVPGGFVVSSRAKFITPSLTDLARTSRLPLFLTLF